MTSFAEAKFDRIYYNDNTFIDVGGIGGFRAKYVLYQSSLYGPDIYLMDLKSPLNLIFNDIYSGDSQVFGKIHYNSKTNIVRPILDSPDDDNIDFGIAPVSPYAGDICLIFRRKNKNDSDHIKVMIDSIEYANIPVEMEFYTALLIPLLKEKITVTLISGDKPRYSFEIKNPNCNSEIQSHKLSLAKALKSNIQISNNFRDQKFQEFKSVFDEKMTDVSYSTGCLKMQCMDIGKIFYLKYEDFCPVYSDEGIFSNIVSIIDDKSSFSLKCAYGYNVNSGLFTRLTWIRNETSPCESVLKSGNFLFF